MNQSAPIVVAGIDVGKSWLDAHILAGGLDRRFANDKAGRRALRNWLRGHGVSRAVLEPTGRYHRQLHQCLFDSAIDTVLVNPLRSRRFAEALGQLAKNDRVDAAMLARFGLLAGLESSPPAPCNLTLLNDLVALRRKLVEQRAALRKLRGELAPEAADGLDATLDAMRSDIAACERRLQDCIAADATLRQRAAILQSVPGLGPLCARGKPPKVALVAVMRQLLTLVNALLRDQRSWQPQPPLREAPA